jgi:glycosyltransferase involved in cell wall biosynthesis
MTSTFPRWHDDKEPPFVFNLCKHLSREFSVHVLAPHNKGAATQEILENIHITRFRYFFPQWQSLAYEGGILNRLKQNPLRIFLVPLFIISQAFYARRLLKRYEFLAIHAHWLIPQGLVAVLAGIHREKTALLCTSHGGDLYGLKHPLFKLIKRWIVYRSDAITVVSRAMRSELGRIAPEAKCQVIPMGTDLTRLFTPSAEVRRRPATVLFVGRLVEKKGVRHLLEAFRLVLRKCAQAQLWIAGSGPERPALELQSRQLGISDKIRFFGSIPYDTLPHLYRSATITIVPSVIAKGGDQEGLGLVTVEALGCHSPVIASDLPAIRDVIQNGVTGLLVTPEKPLQLAEQIVNLLANPARSSALAQAGRRYCLERFDWQCIEEKYIHLLKHVIENTYRYP